MTTQKASCCEDRRLQKTKKKKQQKFCLFKKVQPLVTLGVRTVVMYIVSEVQKYTYHIMLIGMATRDRVTLIEQSHSKIGMKKLLGRIIRK